MKTRFLIVLYGFVILSGCAPRPPAEASQIFNTLITALAEKDYKSFQSPGSPTFQTGITQKIFDTVTSQVSPSLNSGHTDTFLTSLRKDRFDVYVWKLTCENNRDFLVRLSLRDGKAIGFWIN